MAEGALLWGWDPATPEWRPVIVDPAGHLQVDVVTAPAIVSHCYGYDGSNWQTLLVESSAQKNLRVKLYDGANGIDSLDLDTELGDLRGLVTHSLINGHVTDTTFRRIKALTGASDNNASGLWGLVVQANLYGYDGFYFDRLRTYGTGILKVGRAEIGATHHRATAIGIIAAGGRKLFWICARPSAANWVVGFTDTLIAGQPVKFDAGGAAVEMTHHNFDPPIEFGTGLYLETLTNVTALHICFI